MAANKRKEEEDSVLLCDPDTVYTEEAKRLHNSSINRITPSGYEPGAYLSGTHT